MQYINIHKELLTRGLNDTTILYYLILSSHFNTITKQCNPSQKCIETNFGLSKITQQNILTELQSLNFVSKESSYSTSNQYTLLMYPKTKAEAIKLPFSIFNQLKTGSMTYQNLMMYLKLQLLKPKKLTNTNYEDLMLNFDYSINHFTAQIKQLERLNLITKIKLKKYQFSIFVN